MPAYRSNRPLAYAVALLLLAQVLSHAVLAAGECVEAFSLGQSLETYPDTGAPEFLAAALLLTVGGLAQLLAFFATIIAFLWWFYRAAQNAAVFAAAPLEHGPGWAVGGFFVPILNLVRPYQVAREIEAASGGAHSPILAAWWGAFIVNNLLGNVEFRVTAVDALAILTLASTLTTAVGAFFCARMMFYIEGLQAERARSPEDIARVFA